MKWEIRGTKDGKQVRVKVSADSEQAARARAERGGIIVLAVLPMDEAPAAPAAPAPASSAPYERPPQENAAQDDSQAAAYATDQPAANAYANPPAQWPGAAVSSPVPYATPYATPVGPQGPSDPSFGLALASLICGGVGSILFCFWPLAIFLGASAIGLGIAAWVIAKKRNSNVKMAMAGTFVGVVPFLILGTLALGLFTMFNRLSKEAEKAKAQADAQRQVDVAAEKVKQAQREAEDKARRDREETQRLAIAKADAERRAARDEAEAKSRLARQQATDDAKAKKKAEAEAKGKEEADKRAALDVPVAVNAEALIKAYAENPVAADTNYKNHMVDVDGTIAKITRNSVTLFAGDKKSVECRIAPNGAEAITTLKTGQKVTVHGRCTGGSPQKASVRDATIKKV